MKQIIDFYKELDVLNMIIFWGIIIVVILLLVFAIIISKKNKKLKKVISDRELESPSDIPLNNHMEASSPILENKVTYSEETPSIIFPESPLGSEMAKPELKEPKKNIEEEKKFIAEEHVIEYNNDLFSLSNIKKATEVKEDVTKKTEVNNINNNLPRAPYQRNVLKEMSLAQTSPIGIIKKKEEPQTNLNELEQDNIDKQQDKFIENNHKEEIKELPIIKEDPIIKPEPVIEKEEPKLHETAIKEPVSKNKEPEKNESSSYLSEVSKKLAAVTEPSGPDRTAYELKQEEDAIISYEELMQKKDQIKIVDEEDAVISIEELMNKQKEAKSEEKKEAKPEEEKLYNLTDSENNDNFINELKNFRHDL